MSSGPSASGVPQGSWASSPAARATMRANRSRDTTPELAVRRAVHALGLRYRVGVRPVAEVRRTADLVFRREQVAVCVDGCFWHGCPQHHTVAKSNASFWAEKVERNRARDVETTALWTRAGWTVLRVWEHESASDAATRVQRAVLLGRGTA